MPVNNLKNLNPKLKIFLLILVMAGLGFLFLNLAFIAYYLLFKISQVFISREIVQIQYWYRPAVGILFGFLTWIAGFFVFRSKLNILLKASYLFVPVATTLVGIGIFTYDIPFLGYFVSAGFVTLLLIYLQKIKADWKYFLAVVMISVVLFLGNLFGMEI